MSAALLLLPACDHRQSIGGGFELRQAANWNPDGHPGVFLYYKGKEIWHHHVAWGYPYSPKDFFHGDIFVFESSVPGADGYDNYGISPQLYAIRGSGPPVLISQRIMGLPLNADKATDAVAIEGVPGSGASPPPDPDIRLYSVENTSLTGTGMKVAFVYPDRDGGDAMKTNEVSWAQIAAWVDEAEHSSPPVKTPQGNYRLLPIRPSGTAPTVH